MYIDITVIPKKFVRDGKRVKINVSGSQPIARFQKSYPELEVSPRRSLYSKPFMRLKRLKG